MHVIAFDGYSCYVVSEGGNWDSLRNDPQATGRVFDARDGALMPPFNLRAILTRGEWQPYAGSAEEEAALLRRVQQAAAPTLPQRHGERAAA